MGFAIDRSGSMRTMDGEVASGFNAMIADQRKQAGDCSVSVVRFDHLVDVLHDNADIGDITAATDETFAPRGGTALYDAIDKTINLVRDGVIRHIGRGRPPPRKVIITVITDGMENSSSINQEGVREDIRRCREELGWEFVYVGANQNAVEIGKKMGVDPHQCLSFDADPQHGAATFQSISDNLTRQCEDSSFFGFTPLERAVSCGAEKKATTPVHPPLHLFRPPSPPFQPPPPPPPLPISRPLSPPPPQYEDPVPPGSPTYQTASDLFAQSSEDAKSTWDFALKF